MPVYPGALRFARDSGIGCLLRMRASFPDKLMQTKLSQSRPALIQNLCAKKHSVTVHAAFHSSLRPRDGKEEYAERHPLGFDFMRNVVIQRKQPSGLRLDDLFLSVNLALPFDVREDRPPALSAIRTIRRSGCFTILFAVCSACHGCSDWSLRTSSAMSKLSSVPDVGTGWRMRVCECSSC